MITGNKGEWSEFYVLLKLLAEGKLFSADDELQPITDMYFPVLSIYRKEAEGKNLEYDIPNIDAKEIVVTLNDQAVCSIPRARLGKEAERLYNKIVDGGDRAFAIPDMDAIMNALLCERLAAVATDKSDITIHLHDIQTGFDQVSGFSIKSELGSAPTLLNASKATNFVYKVEGLSIDDLLRINALDNPRSKIKDRVNAILENGNIEFSTMDNAVFCENLLLVDSSMDKLIAEMLLISFRENVFSCEEIIKKLEMINPLAYPREGFYEYKFKKFLCSVALGMVPSRPWNGRDEANGGYIVVNKKGQVLTYHIYNRDYFETYLLKHTKFEKASTTRHEYANLYLDGDDMFIKLNLQIRFK